MQIVLSQIKEKFFPSHGHQALVPLTGLDHVNNTCEYVFTQDLICALHQTIVNITFFWLDELLEGFLFFLVVLTAELMLFAHFVVLQLNVEQNLFQFNI